METNPNLDLDGGGGAGASSGRSLLPKGRYRLRRSLSPVKNDHSRSLPEGRDVREVREAYQHNRLQFHGRVIDVFPRARNAVSPDAAPVPSSAYIVPPNLPTPSEPQHGLNFNAPLVGDGKMHMDVEGAQKMQMDVEGAPLVGDGKMHMDVEEEMTTALAVHQPSSQSQRNLAHLLP